VGGQAGRVTARIAATDAPSATASAVIYATVGTLGPVALLLRVGTPVTTVAIAAVLLGVGQFVVMRSLLGGWVRYRRAALLVASQWITGAVLGGGLSFAANAAEDESTWVAITAAVFVVGVVGLIRLVRDVPEPRLAVIALAVEFAFAVALYLVLQGTIGQLV
jgi:hypothetical protein